MIISVLCALFAAEDDQVPEPEGQCIITAKKRDAPEAVLFYFLCNFEPRLTQNVCSVSSMNLNSPCLHI